VTLVVLLLYGIAQFVQLVHQAGETGKSLESVRYGHVVNEGMRGGRIGPSDDCGKIVKGDHDPVVAENAVAD